MTTYKKLTYSNLNTTYIKKISLKKQKYNKKRDFISPQYEIPFQAKKI
jgi:hypothetical protein